MIATLRLEWIGHNTKHLTRAPLKQVLYHVRRAAPERRSRLLDPKCRPWVARIEGRDPRHGFARTFLEGLTDYRDANGAGSRGVFLTFVLYAGHLYEVNELQSWTRTRRYFCEVVNGAIVERSPADVTKKLDQNTGAIQDIINRAARA